MLNTKASPSHMSWHKDAETELRQLHRRKQALNHLIRALEEYALLGGTQNAEVALHLLAGKTPAQASGKENEGYQTRNALKSLLA